VKVRSSALRTLGVLLCLFLGFILSPAANAAFTSSTNALAGVSTARLSTPSPSSVSVQSDCYRSGWYALNMTVSVNSALQYANTVVVIVRKQHNGELILQAEQSSLSTTPISATFSPGGGATLALSYEIRSKYKVPGSTNYWTSAGSLTGTISCRQ
jgi:hypothetical protein